MFIYLFIIFIIEGTKESIHFSQTLADFCSSPWPEGPAEAINNCPYQCIINVFSDILHNGCSFRSRQQSIQRMILNNTQQSSRVTNPHNLKHSNQIQLQEKNLSLYSGVSQSNLLVTLHSFASYLIIGS